MHVRPSVVGVAREHIVEHARKIGIEPNVRRILAQRSGMEETGAGVRGLRDRIIRTNPIMRSGRAVDKAQALMRQWRHDRR